MWEVAPRSLVDIVIRMMLEAISSSEMSANIPEDSHLNTEVSNSMEQTPPETTIPEPKRWFHVEGWTCP
jgi:hypothetical protein